MPPSVLYLHGFASDATSNKALWFQKRLGHWRRPLRIPDLNRPDFAHIELTAVIDGVAEEIEDCPEGPVQIIAASFGALAALHLMERHHEGAAKRVERMLWLAPALDFTENREQQLGPEGMEAWKSTGFAEFPHHGVLGGTHKVHYRLMEDLANYDSFQVDVSVPILIYHGRQDDKVDYHQSVRFAEGRKNVQLELVDSDHRLTDKLDSIWSKTVPFLQLPETYQPKIPTRIEPFDLSTEAGRAAFGKLEDQWIDVLAAAYGERFYGREPHLKRVYGEQHTILLGFIEEDGAEKLVASSCLKPNGKRSAMAVRPEMQSTGIARKLVCSSFPHFPRQFVELRSYDDRMQHLLATSGFTPVTEEKTLLGLLDQDAENLHSIEDRGDRLVYKRKSSTHEGLEHEFVMFALELDPQLV